MRKRVSKMQLQANRQNALKSTGPKSNRGKQAIRWNALKHGLLSKATVLSVPGFEENHDEFTFLLRELRNDLEPVGVLEEMLVEKIAAYYWRLQRVLRSELGETEQGMIDNFYRKASDGELASVISRSESSFSPHYKLMRTVSGIKSLLNVLETTKQELLDNGFVSECARKQLGLYFGEDSRGLVGMLREHNVQMRIMDGMDAFDALKLSEHELDPEEYKNLLVRIIDDEHSQLTQMIEQVGILELHQKNATASRLALPSQETSLKILRYESTVERQFYRAMDQLERLQRRRLGDLVPPPMKLDVTHDT